MTLNEDFLNECKRAISDSNERWKEVEKEMNEANKDKVYVYDYDDNKLGECKDVYEASKVYETPVPKIRYSIRHNTLYNGLRFRKNG